MATEIFRYPRRFKAMTAFSAVVFAALAAMLLKWLEIAPLRQPELFTAIMLTLGVSLAWCVAMFKRADDGVVLDESSIVYRVPGRPTLILQWPEITRVRARDLLQRLDLTDVTGTRRIVVAHQTENFGRLRQMIRERTAPPATAGPPRRVFARSPGSILLSLHWPLIVVMVCVWAWGQDAPRAVYGVLWGVAWGLWSILVPPWRVRLLDHAVAVDSLGWRRTIPYASVVAVRLEELKRPRQGDHGRCGHGPDRDDTRPHGQAGRLQGRLLGALQRARGGVEAPQRAPR
jgi:hypothetical protein